MENIMKFIIKNTECTATEAKKKCSELLEKYKNLPYVDDIDDFEFLKEAFEKYHYNPKEKITAPITKIAVKRSNSGSNHQFHIYMEDGRHDHIGYSKKCFVTNKMKEKLIYQDNVVDAARQMIRNQQDLARTNFIQTNNMLCHICNEFINESNLHADHNEPTFKQIFDDWIELKNIKIKSIKYENISKTEVKIFSDTDLGKDWCEYHKSRFSPKPAHSSCNLKT